MKNAAALIALLLAALLAGCAGPRSLVPGQSTEADVRAAMGASRETRTDANGDLIWEYPTGPEGMTNYRVRMGADRKVKDVTQLVTEEQLEKIVVGKSTRTDVREILGKPALETVYHVGPTWYWRHLKGGTQPGYLVVTFNPDGTVGSKISIIDMPGGKNPM
jgi:SmpA/OmlA family protein